MKQPLGPINFRPSLPFTLGVEVEFQLLDRETCNLVPRAPALLQAVPESLKPRIKQEFIQSMIEVNTEICAGIPGVRQNFTALCKTAEQLATHQHCQLYATSLHPFALVDDQKLTDHDRYRRIMSELQLVGRRFITQGLHVHVGLPDGETAINVFDHIRLYLPILLALSASSPYYENEDTGLRSYRTKLFEALPMAGMPEGLNNWKHFSKVMDLLTGTGIITDLRDLWWDVRPHPDFGTIEIRICDLPSSFREIIALVALIQALVKTLATHPPSPAPNMQVLRSNKWQAARYGLDGTFVDPANARRLPMADAVRNLLALTAVAADELGTAADIAVIDDILRRGSSADRQRRLFDESHNHVSVIRTIHEDFWQ